MQRSPCVLGVFGTLTASGAPAQPVGRSPVGQRRVFEFSPAQQHVGTRLCPFDLKSALVAWLNSSSLTEF